MDRSSWRALVPVAVVATRLLHAVDEPGDRVPGAEPAERGACDRGREDALLIEAIRQSEAARRSGRERTGRLLAELHGRGRLSWPAIARATGIRQTTAYELAQPFLPPDLGSETDQTPD